MAGRFFYRYIFRRTSTFTLSVVIAAFFFERAYDYACESLFERVNEGRLWKHIKHRYENPSNDPSKIPSKISALKSDQVANQKEEPVPEENQDEKEEVDFET